LPAQAKPLLERLVAMQPANLGAQVLLTRVVLEADGAPAGAAQLQKALAAGGPEGRGILAGAAQLVGLLLSQEGHAPAAIRHLHLAEEFGADDNTLLGPTLRMLEGNPALSAWLKHPYELSPVPEGPDEGVRQRFERAVEAADQGLWAQAAAAFDALGGEGIAAADRNAGLCRLWLADETAAAALRRSIARVGETEDAVDLEALCQLVAPLGDDDVVERVQLIWPIKDRDALLAALRGDPRAPSRASGRSIRTTPTRPRSIISSCWTAAPGARRPRRRGSRTWPVVLGRALVGQEIVALEILDDGRLDALKERFTELAGAGITPAHPKTKVFDTMARASAILQTEWLLPGRSTSRSSTACSARIGVRS
jgi:hypothetical protein